MPISLGEGEGELSFPARWDGCLSISEVTSGRAKSVRTWIEGKLERTHVVESEKLLLSGQFSHIAHFQLRRGAFGCPDVGSSVELLGWAVLEGHSVCAGEFET